MLPNGHSLEEHFLPVAFPQVDHPGARFRRAALRLAMSREVGNHSRIAMHLRGRSRRRTHKPEIISLKHRDRPQQDSSGLMLTNRRPRAASATWAD
jgi:hypothetical protein